MKVARSISGTNIVVAAAKCHDDNDGDDDVSFTIKRSRSFVLTRPLRRRQCSVGAIAFRPSPSFIISLPPAGEAIFVALRQLLLRLPLCHSFVSPSQGRSSSRPAARSMRISTVKANTFLLPESSSAIEKSFCGRATRRSICRKTDSALIAPHALPRPSPASSLSSSRAVIANFARRQRRRYMKHI